MKKTLILFALISWCGIASAQNFTVSGYVSDAATGEKLLNTNVYESKSLKGTVTNNYGFYSLTLPAGTHTIAVSFVGYETVQKEITLTANQTWNIELNSVLELEEVVVSDSKIGRPVESSRMSTTEISIESIKTLPVLLGESDIIKIIQMQPGVQGGTEGSSGFYVRGGGPDQNLVLLDGVPVYNVTHLLGFFSVFNADAINSVTLVKGGFPARYGGRLSSVLDIRMKEGNTKKFSGSGSIGIISSKLTLEGPIFSEKTSFLVSARRTYIDVLAAPFIAYFNKTENADAKPGYYFYDLNFKINHTINDKNKLYFSLYNGRDKAYMYFTDNWSMVENKSEFNINWGNTIAALRWNYAINEKLFANSTLTYSKYSFITEQSQTTRDLANMKTNSFSMGYVSGIEDVSGKIDFDFIPNSSNYIRFGTGLTHHIFTPGINVVQLTDNGAEIDSTFGGVPIDANELYAYLEDDIEFTDNFKLNAGIHFSDFMVKGKNYMSVEPRLSARFKISDNWSAKAAYTHMNQNIHLLTSSTIGLPIDLWVPATDKIVPQKSVQYALGTAFTYKFLDISIEGYYKTMDNIIEYKEGASYFNFSSTYEEKVAAGKGLAYGAEILIEKKQGKTTGWIGYTLSWAQRQSPEISSGEWYPYRYDRRHDLSIAITHKFNKNYDIGLAWVFGTGYAVTMATVQFPTFSWWNNGEKLDENPQMEYINYYESRNNYRMAAYHRLDFNFNYKKKIKFGEQTWSFGAYNAYNRQNPFFINPGTKNGKPVIYQYSLFPIIPSVSYSISF